MNPSIKNIRKQKEHHPGSRDIPIRRSVSEIRPRLAVPGNNPTIGNTSVWPSTKRIENDAFRALNLIKEFDLHLLEKVMLIFNDGERGPWREIYLVSFKIRGTINGAVLERIETAIKGKEKENSGENSNKVHCQVFEIFRQED